MAVYLYYQLQYYIASPNDTTTRMMWSQNNPAPFPINFSCAGRSFRPKPPVGNFRKLPHTPRLLCSSDGLHGAQSLLKPHGLIARVHGADARARLQQ